LSLFDALPVLMPSYRAPVPGDDGDPRPSRDAPAHWGPSPSLADEMVLLEPDVLVAPEAPLTPDQTTIFDLAALTIKVPGQEIQEQMEAAGVTVGARKRVFEAAVIKQVVLYFQGDEYMAFLTQLATAGEQFGTDTHTDTIVAAIRRCLREESHEPAVAGAQTS